jgi:hypothetical protein
MPTISAPEYTHVPKTAGPYTSGSVTYTIVPPHTTSHIWTPLVADHYDDGAAHMHAYLSDLWAEDWDSPEDSVYDGW